MNPRATSYGYDRLRFVKPVYIGDTLTVEATICPQLRTVGRIRRQPPAHQQEIR